MLRKKLFTTVLAAAMILSMAETPYVPQAYAAERLVASSGTSKTYNVNITGKKKEKITVKAKDEYDYYIYINGIKIKKVLGEPSEFKAYTIGGKRYLTFSTAQPWENKTIFCTYSKGKLTKAYEIGIGTFGEKGIYAKISQIKKVSGNKVYIDTFHLGDYVLGGLDITATVNVKNGKFKMASTFKVNKPLTTDDELPHLSEERDLYATLSDAKAGTNAVETLSDCPLTINKVTTQKTKEGGSYMYLNVTTENGVTGWIDGGDQNPDYSEEPTMLFSNMMMGD